MTFRSFCRDTVRPPPEKELKCTMYMAPSTGSVSSGTCKVNEEEIGGICHPLSPFNWQQPGLP